MTDAENPYLALRKANIARNEAKLKGLGLLKPKRKAAVSRRSENPKFEPREKNSAKENAILLPVRRSSRLKSTDESNDSDGGGVLVVARKRTRVPIQKTAGSRPTKKAAPTVSLSKNSARNIALDLDRLVCGESGFLGKAMTATGKAAVMNTSAHLFPADSAVDDPVVSVSFNKYSGVQEWKRGIFLWVNLGCKGNTVVNEFLDGGRKMTWYGGSRMHSESSVIQRLVHVGSAASNGNQSASSDGIILWCRQHDTQKRAFSPYYCLGRLAYVSHEPDSMPLSFVWKLLDYDSLVAKQNDVILNMIGKV